MEQPLVVAISAVISNNKILLIKRVKDGFEGLWSLPGGKVQANEHVAQAAVREIQEETGLVVEFEDHLGHVSEHQVDGDSIKHVVLHVCKVTPHTLDVVASEEGELEWWDLDSLEQLQPQMTPSDYWMIEKMVKRREKQYYECVIETIDGKYILKKFE